jgi:hypothetical protein
MLAGSAVLLPGAAAEAAECGTATPAGTVCTATGTLAWASGTLTLTSPDSLAWGGTANGLDQHVVDVNLDDQRFSVVDATGIGAGWQITVAATTFTALHGALANSGTFSVNGSVLSLAATTAPTATCASGSTCTLPTDTTTYPVAITTAASSPVPVTVYDTATSSGEGSINIGGTGNPVGWWLNVPGNTPSGTYLSTITLELLAAP